MAELLCFSAQMPVAQVQKVFQVVGFPGSSITSQIDSCQKGP